MANCETCKKVQNAPESVPYIVHESSMARMERQIKRLWIAVLLLIVMLVGTNAAWLYYESSFEDVVTTTTIESEQDGAGVNVFGGYGGGNGCNAPCATQADVRAAVDQQTLISKIDQQTYGMADSFTALNNTLNNNFRGIDNAICTLGYQGAQHASNLAAQMAQCCCDTRAAIKDVDVGIERAGWNLSKQISDGFCNEEKMNMQNRFDAQAYNCNTLQAIDKLGDRIIDYMSNEKVQALRDENQALRLAASQERQNQYLISQLGYQCPKPAYVVQPPQNVTFPTNCCGGVNYASNGCGCGC